MKDLVWAIQMASMVALMASIFRAFSGEIRSGLSRDSPSRGMEVIIGGLRNGALVPMLRPYFLAMLSLIAFNYIETYLDPRITGLFGLNFTHLVSSVEGGIVQRIQSLSPKNPIALSYFSFMYFLMLMTLLFSSPILYLYMGREDLVRMISLGYLLTYLFAFPFYIFFPVDEVWTYSEHVPLLSNAISPMLAESMRGASAINNCFPSLHTSFSILLAFTASLSGIRGYTILVWVSASSIIFSTIYLGVHWVVDVVGGMMLAAIVISILLLDRRRRPPVVGSEEIPC
jgi:membrane-associated phospholipid phosphatase